MNDRLTWANSIGNIDVTSKDDLEKLVAEIEKKEKCIHLLGRSTLGNMGMWIRLM